jgi:predicted RNA-binding protein
MCELHAYITKDNKEELFLENVDFIRPEKDKVYLKTMFGEERTFQGRIKEIQALKRKIILEKS